MRILLIEDEKRMAQALCEILRLEKYDVDHYDNGTDGLTAIESGVYDIVILDVMLPGMNGYEVAKRARRKGITTPILMLTAKAELDDKVTGLDSGADEATAADTVEVRVTELSAYRTALEKEVAALCESVSGVGDTDVMITLEGGYSVCYVEGDGGGPATVGAGSSEQAIFRRVSPPAVRGVGIVCRGGNRADVQQRLTELVSTALGIPSSYVYITGK